MKKTISILFFLFTLLQCTDSQIKIVDAKTGEAISFAHLVIEGGKSGASSNIDGYIYLTDVEKHIKNPSTTITIQHIGYENMEISWNELKQIQILQLNERDIILSDLIIQYQQ